MLQAIKTLSSFGVLSLTPDSHPLRQDSDGCQIVDGECVDDLIQPEPIIEPEPILPPPDDYVCDPVYEYCGSYYYEETYSKGQLHVMVWTALWQWAVPMIAFEQYESKAYLDYYDVS